MKRGMLRLSPASLHQLLEMNEKMTLTSGKLQAAADEAAPKIELSQEEAESLLDQLPAPTGDEPSAVTTARRELQAFLQELS